MSFLSSYRRILYFGNEAERFRNRIEPNKTMLFTGTIRHVQMVKPGMLAAAVHDSENRLDFYILDIFETLEKGYGIQLSVKQAETNMEAFFKVNKSQDSKTTTTMPKLQGIQCMILRGPAYIYYNSIPKLISDAPTFLTDELDEERDEKTNEGLVYFLAEYTRKDELIEGYIKIGCTTLTVKARIQGLKTGNPRTLVSIGDVYYKDIRSLEIYLHRVYGHKRLAMNTEWFELIPDEIIPIINHLNSSNSASGKILVV